MRKTQTKNSTGKIVLSFILLFLGEGLFAMSLFWPVLFSLLGLTKKTYWLGFLLGLILSLMTGTALGLASLVIVVCLFIFERRRVFLGHNVWLTGLAAVAVGFIAYKNLGLSWGIVEGMTNFGLTLLQISQTLQ